MQIKLKIPYKDFDQFQQLMTTVLSLETAISAETQIEVEAIHEGSTIITIEIEYGDILLLLRAFVMGKLDPLQIVAVRIAVSFMERDGQTMMFVHTYSVRTPWIEKGDEIYRKLKEFFGVTNMQGVEQ